MKMQTGTLLLGICALFALALLEILWHGWWLPPPPAQLWPTLALAVVPLLPGLWISRRNPRRGVLVGGIVCLFYFGHGVSAAWGDASVRALACAQIALALIVIGASGWDARHYRRAPK
jgi:uncharacterized membrane protein